jgi:hypothetical protein
MSQMPDTFDYTAYGNCAAAGALAYPCRPGVSEGSVQITYLVKQRRGSWLNLAFDLENNILYMH